MRYENLLMSIFNQGRVVPPSVTRTSSLAYRVWMVVVLGLCLFILVAGRRDKVLWILNAAICAFILIRELRSRYVRPDTERPTFIKR